MQTLYFEQAWDRTISQVDRLLIEQLFEQTSFREGVHFTYVRDAMNHKEERLVTVIIHNCQDAPLTINDLCIAYEHEHQQMQHTFTLPISINPRTSMPWTFIFPKRSSSTCRPIHTIQS